MDSITNVYFITFIKIFFTGISPISYNPRTSRSNRVTLTFSQSSGPVTSLSTIAFELCEDNEKYSVQGSPTLVLNGKTMKTGRDSASLLQTICAGFNEQPKECDIELSPAAPSPGFGFKEAAAGSTGDAGCGV